MLKCFRSSFFTKTIPNSRFSAAGFTLTEILLAIFIIGIISALVLPSIITKFQNNIFDHSYKREVQSISDLVDKLVVDENKSDFHSTSMYLVSEPESYDESSGVFIKKYMKVSKYCGDDKTNCFASKYYNFEDRTKKEYTFETKGSCAILKNGMSLCISPQIGETVISGWIDLNGKKGPNVLNRDLRSFEIDLQTKTSLNRETKEVMTYCKLYPDANVCKPTNAEEPESSDECPNAPTDKNNEYGQKCCLDTRYSSLAVCNSSATCAVKPMTMNINCSYTSYTDEHQCSFSSDNDKFIALIGYGSGSSYRMSQLKNKTWTLFNSIGVIDKYQIVYGGPNGPSTYTKTVNSRTFNEKVTVDESCNISSADLSGNGGGSSQTPDTYTVTASCNQTGNYITCSVNQDTRSGDAYAVSATFTGSGGSSCQSPMTSTSDHGFTSNAMNCSSTTLRSCQLIVYKGGSTANAQTHNGTMTGTSCSASITNRY